MATCFVIQPFDSGKYDKRFEDIYKPAIEAAGLVAYRVDKDPGVSVLIESIEKGIRQAILCLADITEDNPNVWYELGFSFAAGRQVVMVCSEDRTGKKYPFDIQHRNIISYKSDAPSDFDLLRKNLTIRIKTIIEHTEALEQIAEADPVTPIKGLSQTEILVLALLREVPSSPTTRWLLTQQRLMPSAQASQIWGSSSQLGSLQTRSSSNSLKYKTSKVSLTMEYPFQIADGHGLKKTNRGLYFTAPITQRVMTFRFKGIPRSSIGQ